jgi:hypothetical protein
VKSKAKMLNNFFDIKVIVRKEFVPVGQTLKGICYCGILRRLRENARTLHPELWPTKELAVASRQRTVSHSLYHQEIFDQKQNNCRP